MSSSSRSRACESAADVPAAVDGSSSRQTAFDRVRRLTHRQLAKRHERRLLEEVLQGRLGPFRRIDHAAREPVEQRARREIDHHDFVGLLQHPVGDRLAHADAGALPDLVVQALQVLHVHRRQDVDAGVEQHVHVFPALEPRRSRHVRVRKLVDDGHLGMPAEDRVGVHLLEAGAAVLERPFAERSPGPRSARSSPSGRAARNTR